MRPIIGILAAVDGERTSSALQKYIEVIERSGGLPLILPYVEAEETLDGIVRLCDGFFFIGGADISPSRYGEEPKPTCGEPQIYRDELEFGVFKKAFGTEKPILGVCRGAQLINVALGGTLYQDLPTEIDSQILHRQIEGKSEYSHDVNIIKNTPLHALTGKNRIRANSFHHQAVKKLGEGLEIMSSADDGVIEAFYHVGKRYLRAYQWHPERLYDADEFNRIIFDDFIKVCQSIK